MVPEKRKLMVVSGAIAAALALPGCAPAGSNAGDYGAGAAQPAANAVEAEPTEEPDAATEDDVAAEDAKAEEKEEGSEVPEDELTTELTATSVKRMGEVVTDQDGWVLYRFDKDKTNPVKSNCDGDCEKIWPPALTNDGEPELEGVSSDDVGTVTRSDGTKQLTIGNWPVYRYIGDLKPGQWKGQNVGKTWFVVKPDGTKNLTCLPPASKPVAPPKDDEAESGDESGSAGTDYNY